MAKADQVLSLHDLRNVNTVLSMLYDENGNYRAGFKPEEFYNAILLDTLKFGEENYVHLKYAENLTIKKGFKTAKFRRWAGMTPTLRPLLEGVPPAPDKHAYETLEIGNVWSFGRWSEYTDQVDNSIVSELIAERSHQYGELANQIKELYARKVWLSSPNEYYAKFKAGFDKLGFGDAVTLDDLRFLVARMKRMQVKPVSGKFNYICSPEFIHGLIDDKRVKAYMEIEQTTGKLYGSGEPFDLFELQFIPTMLDEFAYPDTEYPGVYELADGNEVIRLYAMTQDRSTIYYLDIHQDMVVTGTQKAKYNTEQKYLPDGTAIDDGWVKWDVPTTFTVSASNSKNSGTAEATKVVIQKSTKSVNADGEVVYSALVGADLTPVGNGESATASADITAVNALLTAGGFAQLPVHRGILFGSEALVKLSVEGVSDAPRMIVKALGSAGTSDPLDQRQTVGFRVDGFGLAIKRPEAICVTYGIPANAELAALTAAAIYGDYSIMSNYGVISDDAMANNTNNIVDGVQQMHVGGVNNTADIFTELRINTKYAEGELVTYAGNYYVFLKGATIGDSININTLVTTNKTLKKVIITHKLPTVEHVNDPDSNLE